MRDPHLTSLLLASALLSACGSKHEPTTSTQSSAPVIPRVQAVQTESIQEPTAAQPSSDAQAQALADAFAKGLEDSLRSAFEEQARIQALGGTPEQIATARLRFDQVEAEAEPETRSRWMVPHDLEGTTAESLLLGLLEGSGLECDFDGVASRLRAPMEIELAGMSRAQAIEAIASQVGLVPVFPANAFSIEEQPRLTFEAGPRKHPVAFVGPFVLEVTSLEETAPYTVGKLHLAAHALGLSEAVLAANQSMAEWVQVDALVSPTGESLLARSGVRYLSQPQRVGGVLNLALEVELSGLLRTVESIGHVEGSLTLKLPRCVETLALDGLRTAERSVGRWSVATLEFGAKTKLEIRGAEADHFEVLWAPETAEQIPLGVVDHNLYGFGTQCTAELKTSEVPARVTAKLLETEALALPFRLEHLLLENFALQPEARTELRYEHAQPVSVVFVGFKDRSGDFPSIQLRSINLCNKEASSIQVKLTYLDEQNKSIGDCFSTLSAPLSFEPGVRPFLALDAMQTNDQTAFFMPKETVSVQVSVVAVDFLDGTQWEAAR